MRYVVVILLIVLAGIQTFSKLMVILGYELNKDYISKTLCINRDRPKSCCHGKCYLNKKLNQEENSPSYPGEGAKKDLSQLQFISDNQAESHLPVPELKDRPSGHYVTGKSQDYFHLFFQPPRA